MDWVKLSTGYYRDPKVQRAGEAAEVLFTRALAYSGEQETDGHIPRAALLLICPIKPQPRVRALVGEGLWAEVPDGWVIPGWDTWQQTQDRIRARREAGRRRVAQHRARNGVTNAARNPEVTGAEVEGEVDTAAAAADAAAAAALPIPVEILRSKLQAVTALRALRFDGLTPDRTTQLADLIALHGDQVLLDVAVRTCRTPPPVHVAAFLGTWAALPEPGRRLQAVTEPLCTIHDGQHEPASRCRYCAADRLAGDA